MQRIFFFCTSFITILLILVLHGTISIPNNPLPPLGKFLNPFGGAWTSDNENEKTNLNLTLKNIKNNIDIIYDERRVPHIFAQNLNDALYAQGYVEAQNRLFQMDFLAKVAAGELSSIFGPRTLELDLASRRRGMRYAAENAVKGWEKQPNYHLVLSYIEGINAYIKSLKTKDLPFEYKLFNITPTEWTPVKSALIFKQMSLTLAGRNDDIEYTNLLQLLGQENFNLLYPERQTTENPVIPTENPYIFDSLYGMKQDTKAFVKKLLLKSFYENRDKGVGSNSWAVSGSKTETGSPIFCNDPHLSLGLPSIWFEVQIQTPEINAYGVSFPGFPGIMIGFNEYIAWGETNVGQDVEDIYLIKWANKEKNKYYLDDKEMDIVSRIETIDIKGGKSLEDTVKYTHWGPIYRTSQDGNHDLAMRWIAHDTPDTDEFNTFIEALSCKNYDDYLHATSNYISPAQNFGFASVSGDVALRVNGRFPAKYNLDGKFVEYGDESKNGWQDFIPRNQNPQILNPKRGFISSANQVSADKSYPYYFTGKFERYRNRRVNDKLSNMNSITTDDMKKMQQDAYSIKAEEYVTTLKPIINSLTLNDSLKSGWELLNKWDFRYDSEQEAPTLFDLFYNKLSNNTWDEIISERSNMDVKLPEPWRLLEFIEKFPAHKFFDLKTTPMIETAKDIILISLQESIADFNSRKMEGKNNTWGQYKPLHIFHLTRLPALSAMNLAVDGCPDAINATGQSFGPSWRMVVSLENKIKAYAVYPGGQSGNPTSKFYKNMIPAWSKGEYYTPNFVTQKEELKNNTTQHIQLIASK